MKCTYRALVFTIKFTTLPSSPKSAGTHFIVTHLLSATENNNSLNYQVIYYSNIKIDANMRILPVCFPALQILAEKGSILSRKDLLKRKDIAP